MPFNVSSHDATSALDTVCVASSPVRRGRIARWLIALALVSGLGVGVASAQATSGHTTGSHITSYLALDAASTGVTGGPGNG